MGSMINPVNGAIIGVFGLGAGIMAGLIIGNFNRDSFNWNGDREEYDKIKERLHAYSIKAQLPDENTD